MNPLNENEIACCIRKSIEAYLKDLDGEKPCPIYEMVIRSVEKPLFELAMEYAEGNQTKAAELLGINRNTLRNRLAKHQIK
ncbi:MAG TPA: Fis family transcriptional regulator [Nitrosomonas nitrosa]|jgi:Fis family transcriptional regulator|uniref:Putative Fis-like DNA-binding protein n=1 Tax=Nitrosomonas nitrosa TaxID=52442 RepID=A0A1I4MD00_9PROT|nr:MULTISPECIES: helix-turn-helix domain-containing protein [Nitrosomonas]MCO6432871.1 Fis family transcriptional regulator [Nitrosomonas nitrosa]MCW5602097.1 Fis family transcriptional regulator [Nitrosomonas sp.]PTQ94770.1 DNA-binding protein Fis [Nitrosomonas nitrosa]CAE6517714.1 putative Fis-like DNA-binding protein [Nitrosomonas nitrosa]SFM01111.1 DNA-binding protein Fis [Nitrosomonas nitrosa]